MPYESYRGVSSHRPITQEEKAILLAASSLYLPVSILRGAAIGTAALWKLTRLTGILGLGSPDSPGGGGPGHSPISTDIPPSVREQGRAMAEPGKDGRTPSPSVGKESRSSATSRKRCPRGYRWSWKHRKCMKAERLFPFKPWYSRSKYTNGKSR